MRAPLKAFVTVKCDCITDPNPNLNRTTHCLVRLLHCACLIFFAKFLKFISQKNIPIYIIYTNIVLPKINVYCFFINSRKYCGAFRFPPI